MRGFTPLSPPLLRGEGGSIILADYFIGVIYLVLGTIAGILIFKNLDKLGWEVKEAA